MTAKPGARIRVFRRDGFSCRYCGRKPPQVKLVLDHIVPASRGGADREDNFATACTECNSGKSASAIAPPSPGTSGGILAGLYALFPAPGDGGYYQGHILRGSPEDGWLVQLFSWLDGGPTDCALFSHEALTAKKSKLFANPEAWRAEVDRINRRGWEAVRA